jgi:hypothetical protein
MPARIDDLRVRERELDEPDVREIVRHLVDEERRRRFALNAGLLEVLLPEGATFSLAEHCQRLGETGAAAARAGQLACEGDEIGQLHRAFHRRVARKNLFEQRGAGARQADDENRVGCLRAIVAPMLEEISRQCFRATANTR